MAPQRKNSAKKTTTTLNSQWLKNTLKSMGMVGTDVIKDLMPATSEHISSAGGLAKDLVMSMRSSKANLNSMLFKNNPAIKLGQDFFKNALSDIKSGKIYNTERSGGEFGEAADNLDSMFGDLNDYQSNEDNDGDVNIENNIAATDSDATVNAIKQQSEYQVKSTKATVDAMVSIASTSITKTHEIGTKVLAELSTINSNLAALVEYNNTNMTKFIEASIGYYGQSAPKEESTESDSARINDADIFGGNGGLDLRKYKEYIVQNVKDAAGTGGAGGIKFLLENKDMLLSNPLGMILTAALKSTIPQVLKDAMSSFDRSFKNLIPTILGRLGALSKDKNIITSTIAKIFGIRIERQKEIEIKKINKGPIPYNGVANHTIVEIIPKYLRESNQYLREIAKAVTHKSETELDKGTVGFDWKTGKFKNINAMRDDVYNQVIGSVTGTFGVSDFGQEMMRHQSKLNSEEDRKNYINGVNQLFTAIERHEGNLELSDPEHIKELMGSIKASDSIKNLIEAILVDMQKSSSGLVGDMLNAKMKATLDKTQMMKMLGDDPTENGLYQIMNGKSLDEYIANKTNFTTDATISDDDTSDDTSSGRRGRRGRRRGRNKKKTNKGLFNINKEKTQSTDEFQKMLEDERAGSATLDTTGDGLAAKAANKMNMFTSLFNGIISGNADKAWDEFMKGMGNAFKKASDFVADNFLNPMKEELFGTKDENGYTKGGMFEGIHNRMKESFLSLRRMITGKGYKDINGNDVPDANEEEMKNTVVGKLKSSLNFLKESISAKLFGEKDEKGESTKDGIITKFKSKLGFVANTFLEGLSGWKKALFGDKKGDKEDPVEDGKETAEQMKEALAKNAPGAIAGALSLGALSLATGGLSGISFKLLGGAVLGTVASMAKNSEKFKNWLFGEKDENGNIIREGLIKSQVQDYFKKNGKYLAGGGILGALSGKLGIGFLGEIAGGPLVGALLGVGTSIVARSEMFHKFLYGDEKEGQLGLFKTVQNMFSGFGKKADKVSGGKLLGMSGIGAGVGALTVSALLKKGIFGLSFGPMGPIGGALLGLGATMLAQKDNFKEWLFGSTDENGERREGILGQFKNMITAEVLHPLRNNFKDIGRGLKTWMEYDVLDKFNHIIGPLGEAIFGTLSKLTSKTIQSVGDVGAYIKENYLTNVVNNLAELFGPLTSAAGFVGKSVIGVGKKLISAPLDILYAATSPLTLGIGKILSGVGTVTHKVLEYGLIKPVKNLVLKPLGATVSLASKVIAAPFKALGAAIDFITDKTKRLMNRFMLFFTKIGLDLKDLLFNNPVSNWLKKQGQKFKDWGERVQDTFKVVISPITDLLHVAVDEIKGAATRTIKKITSNILGFIGGGLKKLGERIFGKRNKKRRGIFGYIADAWRLAGDPNYAPDFSNETKDGTKSSRWGSFVYKNKNLEKNRQASRDERQRNKNERLIRKYTNNQRYKDTEENRKKVEAKIGHVEWGVEAEVDQLAATKATHEAVKANVEESKKHTNILSTISDTLKVYFFGNPAEKKAAKAAHDAEVKARKEAKAAEKAREKEEAAKAAEEAAAVGANIDDKGKKGHDATVLARFRDAWKKGKIKGVLREAKNQIKGGFAAIAEKKERQSLAREETYDKRNKDFEKRRDDEREAREEREAKREEDDKIKAREKFKKNHYTRYEVELTDEQADAGVEAEIAEQNGGIDKHEKGTGFAKPGLAIVGEAGPEVMYGKNSKFGKFVGLDGPEVVRMKGGETVIPNDRIAKYEDGTENDAKYDHSTLSDNNIVKTTDSRKLTIGERIIRELINIKNLRHSSKTDSNNSNNKETYDTTHLDNLKTRFQNFGGRLLNMIPGYRTAKNVIGFSKDVLGAGKELFTIGKSKVGKLANGLFKHNKTDAEEQAEVTGLSGAAVRAKNAEQKEEDSDDARDEQQLQVLKNIEKGQTSHSGVWNSIFSKKGLITGGIIALIPLLAKFLKVDLGALVGNLASVMGKAISSLGSGIGDLFKDAVWTGKHKTRTNGNNMLAQARYELDEIQNGNIFTDSTGESTSNTDAWLTFAGRRFLNFKNRNFLPKAGVGPFKKHLTSKVGRAEKALYRGIDNVVTTVKNVPSAVAKKATKVKKMADLAARYGDDMYSKAKNVKGSTKSMAKVFNKVRNAGSAVRQTVKTAASSTDKKGLSKVAKYLDNFFDWISDKVAKKAGKKGAKKALDGAKKGLINTIKSKWDDFAKKFFPKLATRTAAGGAGAALTAGLSEVVMTVGSIANSISGTAKLFNVPENKVDGTMKAIAAIIGAISGTTVGSIVDVILSIAGDIAGVDFLNSIAVALYSFLINDKSKVEALENAQADWKAAYLDERDQTLVKQYEAQKKLGVIGDITYDEFVEGVENGTYNASYKSFNDWNASKNKSVGDKFASGIGKVGRTVAKGWGALFGKKETYYTDDKGNKYTKNSDGTYTATSATGENLGVVDEKTVESIATKHTQKKDGFFKSLFKGKNIKKSALTGRDLKSTNASINLKSSVTEDGDIAKLLTGSAIKSGTRLKKRDTVWFDTDGCYYKLEGETYTKYNPNGDALIENIKAEEVEQLKGTGQLTEGEVQFDTKAHEAVKATAMSIKDMWNKAKAINISRFKEFTKWIVGGSGKGGRIETALKNISNSDVVNPAKVIEGGSGEKRINGAVYYSQNDPRWADEKFVMSNGYDDGATMSSTGCGPAAMSMAIANTTKKSASPTELARFAQMTGTRDETGTNSNFIDLAASSYGMNSVRNYAPTGDYIKNAVSEGSPMVLLGQDDGSGKSPYTRAGHYVVAVGKDTNDNILINDPRGASYSKRMNADELANSTGTSWIFAPQGGSGKGSRRTIFKVIRGGKGSGVTAADVVAVALNEEGYREKASNSALDSKSLNAGAGNYTKYARDIGHTNGLAWCATFVCWCFYQAANKNRTVARELLCSSFSASCTTIMNAFKSKGQFLGRNTTPQVGDLVFFNWEGGTSSAMHIGIVTGINGGKIITTEGNTSSKINDGEGEVVKTKERNMKSSYIVGYGRPLYDGISKFKGITKYESSSEDFISQAASMFGTVANTIFDSVLTGNYDIDWDAKLSTPSKDETSTTTTDTTTTANTTSDTASDTTGGSGVSLAKKRYVPGSSDYVPRKSLKHNIDEVNATRNSGYQPSRVQKDLRENSYYQTKYDVDNSEMVELLTNVVKLLTSISNNSKNLELLKDIKTKVGTPSIITTSGTEKSTPTRSKNTKTDTSQHGISTGEDIARRIAFGI